MKFSESVSVFNIRSPEAALPGVVALGGRDRAPAVQRGRGVV
jgi:hypothetical protein